MCFAPMRILSTVAAVCFGPCLLACSTKREAPPVEALQTVSIKLEASGISAQLEIALSMPEKLDAQPVVEAMSSALHRAIRTCTVGAAPLEFKGDRTLSLRLRGEAIVELVTEPGPGTPCLVESLETHKLSRTFEPPVDVHVLLRKLAAP